eukprot:14583511-Alexandrium_andersonii.AAC.1
MSSPPRGPSRRTVQWDAAPALVGLKNCHAGGKGTPGRACARASPRVNRQAGLARAPHRSTRATTANREPAA